jgi:phosphohistidine phosphatase
MELYFLRHGLAGQNGDPKYRDDSLRPLTAEGQEKMQRAALGMQRLGLTFDTILSSPYLRAKQTAEIVAAAYSIKISLTDNLLPPASIKKLLQEIGTAYPKSTNILVVGHEPHLSSMISALLGSKPLDIDLKKGGLCYLTVSEERGMLHWLLTSAQLGLMSKEK